MIPTYNEASSILATLYELLSQPCRPDVIVVDDSSPDGTASVVIDSLPFDDGRVHVLHGPQKGGIGRAYRQGFAEALRLGYGVVVQLDADGSHPPGDLQKLIGGLADADLVIGSRYVPGGSAAGLTVPRRLLSVAGNHYARMFLRLGVRDLTGGYKAWRSECLEHAGAEASHSDGYAFQIEMTLRATVSGARVREVPISFRARRGGVSKMSRRVALEAVTRVPGMMREATAGRTTVGEKRPLPR